MIRAIICVDGLAASGKTTLACKLANTLGFGILLSGYIYRMLAHLCLQSCQDMQSAHLLVEDMTWLQKAAEDCRLQFKLEKNTYSVLHNDRNILEQLISESVATLASKLSQYPSVRRMLLPVQHGFCRPPGLVAEGRDMGTVVFPAAPIKFFLQAKIAARFERRAAQLNEFTKCSSATDITAAREVLQKRDQQDRDRNLSPATPADNAHLIDTTHKDQQAVFQDALKFIGNHIGSPADDKKIENRK